MKSICKGLICKWLWPCSSSSSPMLNTFCTLFPLYLFPVSRLLTCLRRGQNKRSGVNVSCVRGQCVRDQCDHSCWTIVLQVSQFMYKVDYIKCLHCQQNCFVSKTKSVMFLLSPFWITIPRQMSFLNLSWA